jgi:hypothetical protein
MSLIDLSSRRSIGSIHHAEILSLQGDSYRASGKDLDARLTAAQPAIAQAG